MVGSGKGAEQGILIRNGAAIQLIKQARYIVFDKTGTITKGKPEVTDMIPVHGFSERNLLLFAASVEHASEHPLADAIAAHAKKQRLKLLQLKQFEVISGKGVRALIQNKRVLIGNRKLMHEFKVDFDSVEQDVERLEHEAKTVMLVSIDRKMAGVIAVADTLKDDSADAIQELNKLGFETVMITGDNKRTAQAIAEKVGITRIVSEVLPNGKVDEIKKLQKDGVVVMVGDGINDAPALTQADVGIAIGTGTDIAIESSDITIVRGELSAVISAIKLSQATFRKIKQNLFWAFFYNVVAIPVAIMGLLHPVIAEAAMAFSSVTVVTNANLLRRVNIKPDFFQNGA
jgi:Cu+-exporting ATPase